MKMKALDYMIEEGLYDYYADTWSHDPKPDTTVL